MPSPLSSLISILFLSFALALSGCQSEANAEDKKDKSAKKPEVSEKLVKAISERFSSARPDLVVKNVVATGADGVYQVFFEGKGSVYAVGDGEFFFLGELMQIQDEGIVNVTELASNGPRAELISAIDDKDMIVFSPEGKVKASVVVFTDVDCGYCRKMHQEVPKMNELGIEVKYLAYPRAGVGSNSYNKIASAWCADDPREAITALKAGETIPNNVCAGNPVANQFNIGIQAGLSGTPAIVLESGRLIPGYMPAEKLAATLGI